MNGQPPYVSGESRLSMSALFGTGEAPRFRFGAPSGILLTHISILEMWAPGGCFGGKVLSSQVGLTSTGLSFTGTVAVAQRGIRSHSL